MQRDERGVDPAGEAEHDACSKPFLSHVVAQAQHERGVDLGRRARAAARRGPPTCAPAPRRRRARSSRRQRVDRRHARARAARAHGARRAGGRVAAACEVDRRDQQLLRRTAAPRAITLALVVDARASGRRRRARPGRRPGCRRRRRARLSRARWASIRSRSAPLAGVVGRGGDVDDQRRAGQRLVGGGRPGLPDVLADRQRRSRAPPSSTTRRPSPAWK